MSMPRHAVAASATSLWALVALLLFASPASAATTVIGFDDQPSGTAIAEQYASLGVHFGPSPFASISGGLTAVSRSQARSAPNAAAFAYDAGTDFSSSWIKFDKQQTKVSFSACRTGSVGDPLTPNVNVVAYDANGSVIDNQTAITCTLNGALVPVTVEKDHLTYLNVYGTAGSAAPGPGWALDDLSFDTDPAPQAPPPPPPAPAAPVAPDFSLDVLEGPNTPRVIAVRPGGTATRQLVVGRNDTSSGPVALSASGLPSGVSASFDDPAPSGRLPKLVTMTLTAAATAAPTAATVTVRGVPQAATAGVQARTASLDVVVQGQLAAYVKGIEITQGTQTTEQPALNPYQGVELVAGKKTVVRVYAGFLGTAAPGARPEIGMTLAGVDRRGSLLGFPLLPDWTPPPASLSLNEKFIGTAERISPSQAFVFTLPDAWVARGSIALRAQVLAAEDPSPFVRPEAAGATVCIETACGATPARSLNAIAISATPPAKAISAVEQRLTFLDSAGKPLPTRVPLDAPRTFAGLQQISPVPITFLDDAGNASPIPRYRAVRDTPTDKIWEDADAYDLEIGRPGHSTFGAFGLRSAAGVSFTRRTSVGTSDATPGGAVDRPLTVIAHEVLHTFEVGHADGLKSAGGCGGGGGGFPTVTGRLDSVGIDVRFLSGGGVGSPPYRMIGDSATTPAYDLMSYCAALGGGDPDSWISVQNWNAMLHPPSGYRSRAVAAASPGPVLRVRAKVEGATTSIASVDRSSTTAAGAGSSPSASVLVARDAQGRAVATAPMTATQVAHEGDGPAGFTVLDGAVPSAGVVRVEVTTGGAVVANRVASPRAPTARFLTPRARVGPRGDVKVSWRSADADGDPLTVELDYSSDGGRTYHDVYGGSGRSARLPVALLAASTRARLRLRVDDGFNQTAVESRRFVVAPRDPAVTILSPVSRQRVAAGSSAYLSGAAVDATGRVIAGRRLRWFAGRTALGRGAKISVVLPARTRSVRLEATDASGRIGSAAARVRMRATTPFFLRLRTPASISRRARSLSLTASASQPAVLRVASTRVALDRRARTVRVKVRPGRGALALRLVLSAGGRELVQPVRVRRR